MCIMYRYVEIHLLPMIASTAFGQLRILTTQNKLCNPIPNLEACIMAIMIMYRQSDTPTSAERCHDVKR